MRGHVRWSTHGWLSLTLVVALAAGIGLGLAPAGSAQVTATNVQDGNNRGTTNQKGNGKSGAAITGQVIGVVSSGRVSVDASNRVRDSSATSGDANGSNSANSFVGNDVEGLPSCGLSGADTSVSPFQRRESCPASGQDVLFDGSTLTAPIVHDGNNRQTIDQSVSAVTGDALAGGQVIGVVSGGDTTIVAASDARNVDATSGDAHADNSIADAETSNLATFVPCACPPPPVSVDIIAGTINAVIVHDGDNRQTLNQSASAVTGDALAGAQVIGAVTTTGGRSSIDASNRAQNAAASSGDSFAANDISLAASGNAAIDIPNCCSGASGQDVIAGAINAAIVHDGNNRQALGQSAAASTGDALSGAQVIGAVTGGNSSIVAANSADNTDSTSGDAHATNSIADAEASNLVIFAPPSCCTPVPMDLSTTDVIAGNITAINLQDGDNRQTIGQTASAVTGDALSGAQVIGAVTSAGGRTSVDATNRATDTSATSGDAHADNSVGLGFVGLDAENVPIFSGFIPAAVIGVNVQDGDNRQTLHQAADATSGDALSGAQVTGVVSSGGASVVVANTGTGIDATSGDSQFTNSAGDMQTGLVSIASGTAVQGDVGGGGLADVLRLFFGSLA